MLNNILYIILGFILLILGADILVKWASNIAKKFHIPETIIGLTIVCIGTSLPELIITINSSSKNYTDLIVGNAIGINICNLLFILGFISILNPIKLDKTMRKFHLPISIIATIIILFIGNGIGSSGKFIIKRSDGIFLLFLFMLYFLYPVVLAIKDYIKQKNKKTNNKNISVIKAIVHIIIGIFLLKYGSDFVVDYSVLIAQHFNISQRIIGFTIIAIGTALPEIATSIVSIIKKDAELAVANLIGSCTLNLWLILGIGSIINPLSFSSEFNITIIFLLASSLLLWIFTFNKKKDVITRKEGFVLLILFILYFINLFI